MEKTKLKQQYGNNMFIISGVWNNKDTFKLIPIQNNCPYSEIIFDPLTSLLVVISKVQKEALQMVNRLDENGANILLEHTDKSKPPVSKKERLKLKMFTEYYIMKTNEQIDFIEMFATNASSYDYQKILRNANNNIQEMGSDNEKMILPESNIIIK